MKSELGYSPEIRKKRSKAAKVLDKAGWLGPLLLGAAFLVNGSLWGILGIVLGIGLFFHYRSKSQSEPTERLAPLPGHVESYEEIFEREQEEAFKKIKK